MRKIKLLSDIPLLKRIKSVYLSCMILYLLILIYPSHSSAQNLWGMTEEGGKNNLGVIFEFSGTSSASSVYIDKINFTGSIGPNYGAKPYGSLYLANDGFIYGMTEQGGTSTNCTGGCGVMFKYNLTTETMTTLVHFTGTSGAAQGAYPYGNLFQATDGNLYGMTSGVDSTGVIGNGTLFQYNIASSTFSNILNFNGTNGANPYGALMEGSDGYLYGMTYAGGSSNDGVIFQYDLLSKTITPVINFTGSVGAKLGANPYGSLIQATDGFLYGVTEAGGLDNAGVLLKYNLSSSTLTSKSFNSFQIANSYGSLIQASDGNLYGMSYGGFMVGTLFEYNPISSVLSTPFNFELIPWQGGWPYNSLMQASNGLLYGLTHYWNINEPKHGTVFSFNLAKDTLTWDLALPDSSGDAPFFGALIEVGGCPAPVILTTIPNQSVCQGGDISFTANASGPELSYQWTKNDTAITGGTSSIYAINNAQPGEDGAYTCNISNNCKSVQLTSFTFNVNTTPTTNDTIIKNQFVTLGNAYSLTETPEGAGPFTYQWIRDGAPVAGATKSIFSIASMSCVNGDTGTYTCSIKNSCATTTAKVAYLQTDCNRFRYSLTGYVKYDTSSLPIARATVSIANSSDKIIANTGTDANGYYIFVNLVSGTYKLSGSRNYKWGGVNPVDALIVNRTYIGMLPSLTGIKREAADVNDDGKINPTDALMINRRFIGMFDKYKINDWLFTNPTIVINGADISQNITAICAGDVKASYNPPIRIENGELRIENGKEINIDLNKPFDIPVYLNDNTELGALGIKLRIENGELSIANVKSDIDGLIYNITDDGVNVAWSAIDEGYSVTPDKPLFVLRASCSVPGTQYSINNFIQITDESVLSDINENLISTDKLAIPSLLVHSQQSTVSLTCYPNPFNNFTNINYTVPEDANVEINLYNVLGEKIVCLYNQMQQAGNHIFQYDGSSLKQGIYYCELRIQNGDLSVSKTNILMIAR